MPAYGAQEFRKRLFTTQPVPVDLDQVVDVRIAAKYLSGTVLDHPRNFRVANSLSDRRQRRQRVHDVADTAEFYDQNAHVYMVNACDEIGKLPRCFGSAQK